MGINTVYVNLTMIDPAQNNSIHVHTFVLPVFYTK